MKAMCDYERMLGEKSVHGCFTDSPAAILRNREGSVVTGVTKKEEGYRGKLEIHNISYMRT